MIIDRLTTLASTTADTTVSGGTSERIGSAVPIGSVRDIAQGQPVYVTIVLTSASSGAGAGQFWIVSATSATFSPATATRHVGLPSFNAAELNTRRLFSIPLPTWQTLNFNEFLGVIFVADTGSAIVLGRVTAVVTLDPVGVRSYPAAIS